MNKKASEHITKAVSAIVLDDPFYGYLILSRRIIEDSSVATACTNGTYIKYNPEFVTGLSLPKLKGLLKHEVMHIAHMHHLRRGARDPDKWNRAADYAINGILIKAGVELPDDGLHCAAYDDLSTEAIYNQLPDADGPQGGQGSGLPKWNWGGVEDAPGAQDEATRNELEQDVRTEVMNAHNAAKIMGNIPAGIERLVEKIQQSRMPWRTILARFFRAATKDDETWRKPNRRYLAHDLYLPSRHTDALGPIVIGVDTSGSVNGEELMQFFGCVSAILKQTRPESIHLVYCDHAVASTQKLTVMDLPLSPDKFKPKGGGGTSFRPVFEYVDEHKLKPAALLYLTDMHGIFPNDPPAYPVIWCATTEIKAPFGKTLELAG